MKPSVRAVDRLGVTVLGIGNPLMGDDGVGIALPVGLMALDLEQEVSFVDGGTIGMSLLPLVLDADSLLVLDAVSGPKPGTVMQLSGDQLPRLLRMKLSPHQMGLLDALAGARLWVLMQTGFAVTVLDEGSAQESLALFGELGLPGIDRAR